MRWAGAGDPLAGAADVQARGAVVSPPAAPSIQAKAITTNTTPTVTQATAAPVEPHADCFMSLTTCWALLWSDQLRRATE